MSTISSRGSNSSRARLASLTVPTERASPPRSLIDSSSPFRVARSSSTMRTFKPSPLEAQERRKPDLRPDRAERRHPRRRRTTERAPAPFPNSSRRPPSAARTTSPDPPRRDCRDSRCAPEEVCRLSREKQKPEKKTRIRARSRRGTRALPKASPDRPPRDLRSVLRGRRRRWHTRAEPTRPNRRTKTFRRGRGPRGEAPVLSRRDRTHGRVRSSRSPAIPKGPLRAQAGGWLPRGGAKPLTAASRDREGTCAGTGGGTSLRVSPGPASTRHPLCYKHQNQRGHRMPKAAHAEDASVELRPPAAARSSLKTRLKVSAFVGLGIIAAWLYYTVNQVLTLYDVTRDIQRTTDLRERVGDAKTALAEAEDALDRYTQTGQGYDLSRHHNGRTTLRASLGAIRRRILSESSRGSLEQSEAAEEIYSKAADRAIGLWAPGNPSAAREQRDNVVEPAAAALRDVLLELDNRFGRSGAIAEGRLAGARDSATAALVILAGLILAGLLWLLAD